MYKKKSLFIVFEGIEGSGKSYQSLKLLKALKKKKIPTIVTREPGGTLGAERIREVSHADILTHEHFRNAFSSKELLESEDSGDLDPNSEEAQEKVIERIFSERLPWGSKRKMPPREEIERFKKMGRFNSSWFKTPTPTVEVRDLDTISLARREWIAVHTPGHTNDHLCLWDPVHGIMFSGDHVLPTITPHIGGISPEKDPLAKFFESLKIDLTISFISFILISFNERSLTCLSIFKASFKHGVQPVEILFKFFSIGED